MTTRQQILIAVANGCRNTRQIAGYLDKRHGNISNMIYGRAAESTLQNGDLLQWEWGKANTLRLGPRAVVIKHKGKVVGVGRIEIVY